MDRPANGIYGLFGSPYLLPAKPWRQPPGWPVEPHVNEDANSQPQGMHAPTLELRTACGVVLF
jgi:hypothetical protein